MLSVEQILNEDYTHYTGGIDKSEQSYNEKVAYILSNYKDLWAVKLQRETGLCSYHLTKIENKYKIKIRRLTEEEKTKIRNFGIKNRSILSDYDKKYIKQFYEKQNHWRIAEIINKEANIVKNYITQMKEEELKIKENEELEIRKKNEEIIQRIKGQGISVESLVPETGTILSGLDENYYNLLINLNSALNKIVDYSNKGRKISKEVLFYILEEYGFEQMVANIYKYVLKEK